MLAKARRCLQYVRQAVHNSSTTNCGYPQFIDTRAVTYGCIVVTGVGDAIGDIEGTGWAVAASVVALATNVPTRIKPTNQRFILRVPSW
jgi:hypothetical protein